MKSEAVVAGWQWPQERAHLLEHVIDLEHLAEVPHFLWQNLHGLVSLQVVVGHVWQGSQVGTVGQDGGGGQVVANMSPKRKEREHTSL